eukprot:scaffold13.g284.t1
MSAEEVADVAEGVQQLDVEGDDLDLGSLDFGKKKKKKKSSSKSKDAAEAGDGEAAAEGGEAEAGPAADEEVMDDDLNLDLTLGKKKKKKKAKAREFEGLEGEGPDGDAGEGGERKAGGLPWEGSDRDYTPRVLHPAGEQPGVAREGTKKTVFTNFMELCKSMNRNHEHVQAFLLAELGTSGSLDGQQRLVVKGRFLPKAFEGVLRRYINEYVLCNSCKSPDTLLDRDSSTRIMFLRCQQCGASRTVSAIKAGFSARTVSRRSQQTG